MKRIVLLFLLFAFIIGVFLFGVLGLWRMNKENLTQEGLRYHILTKNTADKMGTVSVIGCQKISSRTRYTFHQQLILTA